MKSKKAPSRPPSPLPSAGPALRRAAKVARKIAKMHGTRVWYIKDGKIVSEKP